MRRKTLKCILAVATAVLCLMGSHTPRSAAAEEMILLPVSVKYGQTEARTMLKMINDFRTGSDAWYWNEDNTQKVFCQGLSTLTYDYGLEQIAMQRAVEIAAAFSHSRPNGDICFTAAVGTCHSYAENIAAGANTLDTAESAFVAWQETDRPYEGQGHRRNMLESFHGYVGIGHAYVNGCHYWVQEFSPYPSQIAPTTANDGNATVNIEVKSSLITKMTVEAPGNLTLSPGSSIQAPTVDVRITMADTWPGTPLPATVLPDWTVSGSAVTVNGDKVTANSVGTGTLSAVVYGRSVSVAVTVECSTHKWESWITQKAATCTDAGIKTRQCSVCKAQDSRTIAPTGHSMGPYQLIRAATETEEGLEERTCAVCGKTEQRVLAKLPSESTDTTSDSPDATTENAPPTEDTASDETDTLTDPTDTDAPVENVTESDTETEDTGTEGTETEETETEECERPTEEASDIDMTPDPTESGDPSVLYIVIPSVSVLLMAGGLCTYLIFRARKKRSGEKP